MEFVKIFNENPPKRTIICAPSAYGCGLGCTFCHLTKAGSKNNEPISYWDFANALNRIDRDEKLPLLISLMGAGEPLLNLDLVEAVASMYPVSIATSLPTYKTVFQLVKLVRNDPEIQLKIYLSIHSFLPEVRASLMPNSIRDISEALYKLSELPNLTDTTGHANTDTSRCVIHYTVIPGVNNSLKDFLACMQELKKLNTPPKIKFLSWSDGNNLLESKQWISGLHSLGFKASYHKPNASDIGGACGQFNPEYYQ
jgi:adenine C2-methylase RlmN of 23S rRNA A2503 and tRNA A37